MDCSKKGLTKAAWSGGSHYESREPRAESREPRAESREPRAESREPRAESREPRAESREPRAQYCLSSTRPPSPPDRLPSRRGGHPSLQNTSIADPSAGLVRLGATRALAARTGPGPGGRVTGTEMDGFYTDMGANLGHDCASVARTHFPGIE